MVPGPRRHAPFELTATLIAAAIATSGCGEDAVSGDPLSLTVRAVPYAGVGDVREIVPLGASGLVLSADGVRTLDATGVGEVSDPTPRAWQSATPLGSVGGSVVALGADEAGVLWRLSAQGSENASGRYALGGHAVRHVRSLGPGALAAATDDGLFVVWAGEVVRYDTGPVDALGGGAGAGAAGSSAVVVWRSGDRVVRLDIPAGTASEATVPGADAVAVGAGGDVVIADGGKLWWWHGDAIDGLGDVGSKITDLQGFGGPVWFLAGGRAGRVDGGRLALSAEVGTTNAAPTRLWLRLDGDGGWLARPGELVSFGVGMGTAEDLWATTVRPIYLDHCAKCHDAEKNLLEYDDWDARREKIRTRVIVKKEMPPAGEPPLGAADLDAITAWLDRI